ncbi:MAG: DUF2075 domain-containing protein [Corallococcus sp.]|nr:DUF2075 domain-containing protein [Corallococcus sp.]
MKCYIETKRDFANKKADDIIKILRKHTGGQNPPIASWKNLICDLQSSAKFKSLPDNAIIAMEYRCPTNGMSIDLLVAGVDASGQKHAFVIEAKRWSDDYINSLALSDNRRRENSLHPQIQASRQAVSLGGYTDCGAQYRITPYVYVKCSQQGVEKIISTNNDNLSQNVQVYNNIDSLLQNICKTLINCNEFTKTEILFELKNAEFQPSKSVIDAVKNIVASEPAFDLTESQQVAYDEILDSIQKNKRIIRITGAAGSGKTAILLQLYLKFSAEGNKMRPILITGAYNTDYYRSLFADASGIFEFSHSLDKIINKHTASKYIVLMDEAQHNEQGEIDKIISVGVTLVVCYDENQTIRATNCIEELKQAEYRKDFVNIRLEQRMRYNGSDIAETNIRNFLEAKSITDDDKFLFKPCSDISQFESEVKQLIVDNPKSSVAVVGLLCNDRSKYTSKSAQPSLFYIKWKEKGECDWMKYVHNRNYLQNGSKIWLGTWWMQGLDVDYVAVLAGDDVTLTDSGLKVNLRNSALYQTIISVAEKMCFPQKLKNPEAKVYAKNILDYVDSLSDSQFKQEFEVYVSKYVTNYYYIMMTRGRKGCIVCFCDNNRTT